MPESIVRVTLRDGRTLRCDSSHKLFEVTEQGYVERRVSELEVGTKVAVVMPTVLDLPTCGKLGPFEYQPPRKYTPSSDPRVGRP
jgi:hypothetical protein